MSSTRYADEGDELKQNRWASSPDFSTSVNALIAAKRIALITDRDLCGLLWFIQWRSLEPRGLRRLAEQLVAAFPERLGTPAMRRFHCKPGKKLPRAQTIEIRDEFPGDYPLRGEPTEVWSLGHAEELLGGSEQADSDRPRCKYVDDAPAFYRTDDFLNEAAARCEDLHEHLMRLCVNPGIKLDRVNPKHWDIDAAGVWYFDSLLDALKQFRSERQRGDGLADTETNRHINSALDFCFRRSRMILIEGKAGIGKTAALKAWCDRQQGLARYVEVPSSNDDRSFFSAIAESLGVAKGTAYNGQQIKLRVEEALRASGLMLVMDESQFLWPQYIRPQGIPSRIQWIKSAFDAGTPIALAALPKFSEWQSLYAKRTLWDDDQLERRLNRKVPLPDAHSKEDLLKIARARHPDGDKASWTLLAGYALAAAKKQASAITEALESALDMAQQDGRDAINYDDIDAAVQLDFKPLPAPARVEKGKTTQPARSVQPTCREIEKPLSSTRRASSNWAELQTRIR